MSANAFNVARRMSSRNEPDFLRKSTSPSFVLRRSFSFIVAIKHGSTVTHIIIMLSLLLIPFDTHSICFFIATTEEDMMGNSPTTTATTPPNTPPSRRECFDMLNKVCPDSPLPKECDIYSDVTMANVQRRNTDPHNQNIAFAGMNAGEANAARAARDRGFLHHAQVQRRMTAGGKKRIW